MKEDNDLLICIKCAKDNRLKHLIERTRIYNKCTYCLEENYVIDVFSNEFSQMIKALIRYHFSEWDYNTHFGGEDITTLIDESNLFFNHSRFLDKELFDDLLDIIYNLEVYPKEDEGVSLYSGYSEHGRNSPLESIRTILSRKIVDISTRLITENYFLLESEMTSILNTYLSKCTLILTKNSEYFRARVGYEKKKKSIMDGWTGEMNYVPFSYTTISAPPPNKTSVGRLNRHGVSFFYCATDKYTAISEIRPHPGDIVSIGKFILKADVKIFDLSDKQFINYYLSDNQLSQFEELNTLCEFMNKVILPSERENYNITQLIADCIRLLGFDGVFFNSSISSAYNLVLFDPNKMEYTENDTDLVKIDKVDYQFSQEKWLRNIDEIIGIEDI